MVIMMGIAVCRGIQSILRLLGQYVRLFEPAARDCAAHRRLHRSLTRCHTMAIVNRDVCWGLGEVQDSVQVNGHEQPIIRECYEHRRIF
jgi:hypothetical protein